MISLPHFKVQVGFSSSRRTGKFVKKFISFRPPTVSKPHLNLIAANLTHLLNGKSPSSGKKSFFPFSSSFLQTLIIVFVDFPLFGGWLGKTFQLIYLRQQQKQCRKVDRKRENLLHRNTWSRHFSTQVAKTGFKVADQLAKRLRLILPEVCCQKDDLIDGANCGASQSRTDFGPEKTSNLASLWIDKISYLWIGGLLRSFEKVTTTVWVN